MLLSLSLLACKPGGIEPPPAPPAWTCDEVADTFDAACVVCHGGEAPLGQLNLESVAAVLDRRSNQWDGDLVVPFDPEASYLSHKLSGTHLDVGGSGAIMPPPSMEALSSEAIAGIDSWIAEGAACDLGGDADTDVDSDTDADTDTETGTVITECDHAQDVLDTRCIACHGAVLTEAGLDLRDHEAVVDLSALTVPMPYVDGAGDLGNSYLWHKIHDTHATVGGIGDAMPPPTEPEISVGELDILDAWMEVGGTCRIDTGGDADTDADADSDVDTDVDADTDADTDPQPDGCTDVQDILDANCTSCHGTIALDGLDLRRVVDAVGVPSGSSGLPLIDPGNASGSYLVDKLEGSHLAVGGAGVAMPPLGPLDPADLQVITDWIDAGATCAVPPPPPIGSVYDPNELDPVALFQCDGSPSSSEGRLHRLNRTEWTHQVGHEIDHPANANPLAPPSTLPYRSYADGVGMDPATLDLYFGVGVYAGHSWKAAFPGGPEQRTPRTDTTLRCIYNDTAPDASCIDYFLRSYFAKGIGVAEPSQGEIDRLTAFTVDALADEVLLGQTRTETMIQVTAAAWTHPSALFPSELGVGAPDANGRRRLGNWEAARMVGRMLGGRQPGSDAVYLYDGNLSADERYTAGPGGHLEAIKSAAEDGTIQQATVMRSLVRQYAAGIDGDRKDEWVDYGTHSWNNRQLRAAEFMSENLDAFFLEWLDVEGFATGFQDSVEATTRFTGDPNVYGINRSFLNLRDGEKGIEPTGVQIFNDAVARVVAADTDVLRTLLTTTDFYLASTTESVNSTPNATIYTNRPFNIEADVAATRTSRWHTLPASERAGVLTHPVWLASHGDAFEDGPSMVLRGHWIRENLLCESVPPLELVTVDAQLIPSDGVMRARDRVDQSIEIYPECMACHQSMNSLGRAFEIYNHAGFLRESDHGQAPDGSTVLENMPDPALNGTYTSALDMMDAFADSPIVKQCFVRQTFRHFAGRDETLDDGCVLSEMESAYDSSGGSFVSMIEVLASHDTLMYRTNEDEVLP